MGNKRALVCITKAPFGRATGPRWWTDCLQTCKQCAQLRGRASARTTAQASQGEVKRTAAVSTSNARIGRWSTVPVRETQPCCSRQARATIESRASGGRHENEMVGIARRVRDASVGLWLGWTDARACALLTGSTSTDAGRFRLCNACPSLPFRQSQEATAADPDEAHPLSRSGSLHAAHNGRSRPRGDRGGHRPFAVAPCRAAQRTR